MTVHVENAGTEPIYDVQVEWHPEPSEQAPAAADPGSGPSQASTGPFQRRAPNKGSTLHLPRFTMRAVIARATPSVPHSFATPAPVTRENT
jgi:hypothetical protein